VNANDKMQPSSDHTFDLDRDHVLFLVPYAHLDTQWRWDYRTTIDVYLRDTLEENFELFEKYPHYVFNFSGAIRYQMIKEYYPEAYEKLKTYVVAGRWHIAGACVDEADAVVPSAESLIRQVLYGSQFFRKEFGVEPVDYILPDCFGFPWSLPSILAHCGIKGFSTQKLRHWSSAAGIPFSVGVWEGPDGNGIVAALDPGIYNTVLFWPPHRDVRWMRRLKKNGQKSGVWADFRYYGKGDVGGAPQEISVRMAEKSLEKSSDVIICQCSSDRLYRELTEAQKGRLPIYSGDLLLAQHSAGSITSQAAVKRWNRKNELLADAAERAAVMADSIGMAYPMETLRKGWQRVLGSQMHDILPGTSIPPCYDFTHNDEVIALNTFAGVLTDAVGAIASRMDTSSRGTHLVLLNPLAFAREDIVEAVLPIVGADTIQIYDPDGLPVPTQVTERTEQHIKVIFPASLPACGVAIYVAITEDQLSPKELELRVDEKSLENHRYRIELDGDGNITSIVDKVNGNRELLAQPIQYQFLKENPLLFPAWNMRWRDRNKRPSALLGGPAEIEILEEGPVRVSLCITRRFGPSVFQQQVRLACGSAGEHVEFNDRIDWRGSGYSFKVAFPLTVSSPQATYNWGLGKIERGNNDPKKYEVPSHQWFDLTDPAGHYGVTIMEDCKYGSDKPVDSILRLTLLYTPKRRRLSFMFRDQSSQDWGRHQVLYGLYGHPGDWREGDSERMALRLNQPPAALIIPATGSPSGQTTLGRRWSFLGLSSPQVDVRALKKAEEGPGYILRLQELWGRRTGEQKLSLGQGIAQAWEVDGRERRIGPAGVDAGELVFRMDSYEIKSFAVVLKRGTTRKHKPVCVPVDLPFNIRAFTPDSQRVSGQLPGGRSYPLELISYTINCGDVPFRTGAKELAENALFCSGQEIPLPEGDFDRLFLLAAAEQDTEATFLLGSEPCALHLQALEGFIGQWDRRVWDKPMTKQPDYIWRADVVDIQEGFIKRDRIGWYTTHMHCPDGNDTYAFGYMFVYDLRLPEATRSLVLPNREDVFVFAATLASGLPAVTPAAPLYDELPILMRETR
jgi:alpha-mannosidase